MQEMKVGDGRDEEERIEGRREGEDVRSWTKAWTRDGSYEGWLCIQGEREEIERRSFWRSGRL